MDARNNEIKEIHLRYADFYKIGSGFFVVFILFSFGFWLFGYDILRLVDTLLAYVTNVWTELLGIIMTILVLDRLNERRVREELKRRLIGEARGQSNEAAKVAIDRMREEGWLIKSGGNTCLLAGAQLQNAKLMDANFEDAHMENTYLYQAKLQGANFTGTFLKLADLSETDLRGANLRRTTMQEAFLRKTNLQETVISEVSFQQADLAEADMCRATLVNINFTRVILWEAKLENAKFINTILEGADLEKANLCGTNAHEENNFKCDENTILPDGNKWTSATEMKRYTNPEHPDFWEPDWVKEQRKQGSGE
jgi:uncharacterized protein YjbI with pentapeptide repeats